MLFCMRTTLVLNDDLMRALKQRVATEGGTLTAAVETALRAYLRPPPRARQAYAFEPLSKRGRLRPGIDLDDRDALYRAMEDHDRG